PIGAVAKVVEVAAGEILFQQGEPSPNIFVVAEGQAALEMWVPGRGTTRIQTVTPGELLGWTPLLSTGAMTCTARAREGCRLVRINALQLLGACGHNPDLGMEVLRRTAQTLARRLNATRLQLLDAYAPVGSE